MVLVDVYPAAKLTHVAMVLASGGLFFVRGAAVLAGAGWAMARPLRLLSYAIDTVLLAAGLSLLAMLQLNPFVVTWLGVKLALLSIYIILGSMALKRARSARIAWFAAAVRCYAFMISVARSRDPMAYASALSERAESLRTGREPVVARSPLMGVLVTRRRTLLHARTDSAPPQLVGSTPFGRRPHALLDTRIPQACKDAGSAQRRCAADLAILSDKPPGSLGFPARGTELGAQVATCVRASRESKGLPRARLLGRLYDAIVAKGGSADAAASNATPACGFNGLADDDHRPVVAPSWIAESQRPAARRCGAFLGDTAAGAMRAPQRR